MVKSSKGRVMCRSEKKVLYTKKKIMRRVFPNVKVPPIDSNLKIKPIPLDSLSSNGLCHSTYETPQDLYRQNPYDGTVHIIMAVSPQKLHFCQALNDVNGHVSPRELNQLFSTL